MKKKLSLALALGLVCSTVLTGCGGGNAETQPQTIAAPTTEAATEAATTEAAQAETEANGAQEMVFVLSNEPDGIDPGVTNNSFASTFLVDWLLMMLPVQLFRAMQKAGISARTEPSIPSI